MSLSLRIHKAGHMNTAPEWRLGITNKETEDTKCDECRVAWGGHTLDCSKITLADAIKQAKYFRDLHSHNESTILRRNNRLESEVAHYQAKFMQVKHENNQLRKKLTKEKE
jgi:hypothetical protein